jgi:hypothetical protein
MLTSGMRRVIGARGALWGSLLMVWLNFLLTARWAHIPGSLHGPKRPWFLAALTITTTLAFRRWTQAQASSGEIAAPEQPDTVAAPVPPAAIATPALPGAIAAAVWLDPIARLTAAAGILLLACSSSPFRRRAGKRSLSWTIPGPLPVHRGRHRAADAWRTGRVAVALSGRLSAVVRCNAVTDDPGCASDVVAGSARAAE